MLFKLRGDGGPSKCWVLEASEGIQEGITKIIAIPNPKALTPSLFTQPMFTEYCYMSQALCQVVGCKDGQDIFYTCRMKLTA